ncbi:g-patch domain containing protein [Ophiostoma piceae UAMH 11346]|uniref:G-patch domain containing protein n=1 Tax=Ophiostoma piceae (strain UAMH 11346) TaxID=1262450 RepID=S3CGZ1_OPHP1|nr:g-patch domain containing protein [Ophiostoma piceae UAMH 11346]
MADDDDYMTMTFEDDYASTTSNSKKRKPVETSLQRRIRLEREGRERGNVLSKAEQAKAAEREREAALSRSLFDAPVPKPSAGSGSKPSSSIFSAAPAGPKPASKGFAMMAKMGFVAGQALGKKREPSTKGQEGDVLGQSNDDDKDRPLTEPIRIHVKRDRAGIGAEEEQKEREEEERKKAASNNTTNSKPAVEVDPYAYRDRIRLEREEGRLERQIHAAQVVAERLANGDDDDSLAENDERALFDVNVLWRGMVKQRREKERERALLIKSQKLLDSRLRGLGGETTSEVAQTEDSDDEADDLAAKGKTSHSSYLKTGMSNVVVDEDDDDREDGEPGDEELAEFDALPTQERLQQVVDWMRLNRRYCFWCKHKYPSDDLDGCPGSTEADHD